MPRALIDRDVGAGGDAGAVEVERMDVGRGAGRQVASDGDSRGADRLVVQLAAHHEPVVVAVALAAC